MSGKRKPKLPLLEIEEEIFLNTILTSNGADVIAKRIYCILKEDITVSEDLKTLYREGLWGKEPGTKRRLRNRIYAIKRLNRNHPNVRKLDLLHAQDYTQMDAHSLTQKMKDKKDEDKDLQINMLKVTANRKRKNIEEENSQWQSAEDQPEKVIMESEKPSTKKKRLNDAGSRKIPEFFNKQQVVEHQHLQTTKDDDNDDDELITDHDDNDESNSVELVRTLFEDCDVTAQEETPLTANFRTYYNLESGEEVLSEIDDETSKEIEGDYFSFENDAETFRPKLRTYDSRPRNKFDVELAKKRKLQAAAEEWLEEKRKQTALKEKAKRSKGFKEILLKRHTHQLDISLSSDEEDVVLSFDPRRSNSIETEEEIKKSMVECTQLMNKTMIDHAAYIRASADLKRLNLDKYKGEIRKEMKKTDNRKKCKESATKPDSDRDESDNDGQGSNEVGWKRPTLSDDPFDAVWNRAYTTKMRKGRLSLKRRTPFANGCSD